MDLTLQVPIWYCSLQHWPWLSPPGTFPTRHCFCFGSASSFFLQLFLRSSPIAYWTPAEPRLGGGSHLPVFICFCLSHYSWGSQGKVQFSSVQSLSCVWLFVTPWTAAHQASLSIINSRSLLKLMSIQSVMPFNHPILCHPLLLLPSIFPSIRVFSNESVLHIRWPEYWSFNFSITPSNEYSALISFRMDLLDVLAVQGTLGRDSRESSPTPEFKIISSSVLNFLYSPTLKSIHDCWKNHSFWLYGPLLAK